MAKNTKKTPATTNSTVVPVLKVTDPQQKKADDLGWTFKQSVNNSGVPIMQISKGRILVAEGISAKTALDAAIKIKIDADTARERKVEADAAKDNEKLLKKQKRAAAIKEREDAKADKLAERDAKAKDRTAEKDNRDAAKLKAKEDAKAARETVCAKKAKTREAEKIAKAEKREAEKIERDVKRAEQEEEDGPASLNRSMQTYREQYRKFNDSCGDDLAEMLRSETTKQNKDGDDVLDLKALWRVAKDNGVDYKKYGHLNPGHQRMVISNVLRGMLNKGTDVKVGNKTVKAPPAK
ncbi:hypothetical protein LCGC14_0789790 [marine sediment metagenome]|uniref:Uncharacterized protein n=1 Tax=marine sediment metagenome TaxID=412755 RepID=A0A0F9T032_9ZZZZ